MPEANISPFVPPQEFDEYRVLRPLGHGAMGQVYLGHDRVLDRDVAIKFISGPRPSPEARDRFLVEARAIARLNHPNVVGIYRVGELEGRPYLVSEYVLGAGLETRPRPMPWREALRIGLGLARGLGAAHLRGVLHRDIKPANVVVGEDGAIKLLDFGLAKLLGPGLGEDPVSRAPGERGAFGDPLGAPALALTVSLPPGEPAPDASPRLTREGTILGTPLYMAPELWRGDPASPRSDVYALGALLFELCTGRPPHSEDKLGALQAAVQDRDAPGLAERVPDVDPAFGAAVDRCLQRDPLDRFASAVELERALASLGAALGIAGWPAVSTDADRTLPERRRVRAVAWLRRRRAAVLSIGAALLLGALVLVGLWLERGAVDPQGGRVRIPGGRFAMGSSTEEIEAAYGWSRRTGCAECQRELYEREQPLRQVQVSPFLLDRTEVSNEDFAVWLNGRPGLRLEHGRLLYDGAVLLGDLYPHYGTSGLVHAGGRYAARAGYERRPVAQVTWEAAQMYCRARGGRLPTEAEWELAARGEGGHRFPWGDEEPRCDGVVFGRTESGPCATLGSGPGPIGGAAQDRTPLGVMDLAGGVSEWVMDRFQPRYPACPAPCRDPVSEGEDGGAEGDARVVRGGAWYRAAEACRAAGRSRMRPSQVAGDVGFRCAATIKN